MKRVDFIEIRSARLSDMPSIVEILQNALPDLPEFRGVTGSQIVRTMYLRLKFGKWVNRIEQFLSRRSLRAFFTNAYDPVVFVAEEVSKSKVVGVVLAFHMVHDVWSLGKIAVLPNYRGRGIGHQLVKKVISHAESKGGKKIDVHVRTDNPSAIKLYTKSGFTIANQLHYMTRDLSPKNVSN